MNRTASFRARNVFRHFTRTRFISGVGKRDQKVCESPSCFLFFLSSRICPRVSSHSMASYVPGSAIRSAFRVRGLLPMIVVASRHAMRADRFPIAPFQTLDRKLLFPAPLNNSSRDSMVAALTVRSLRFLPWYFIHSRPLEMKTLFLSIVRARK